MLCFSKKKFDLNLEDINCIYPLRMGGGGGGGGTGNIKSLKGGKAFFQV